MCQHRATWPSWVSLFNGLPKRGKKRKFSHLFDRCSQNQACVNHGGWAASKRQIPRLLSRPLAARHLHFHTFSGWCGCIFGEGSCRFFLSWEVYGSERLLQNEDSEAVRAGEGLRDNLKIHSATRNQSANVLWQVRIGPRMQIRSPELVHHAMVLCTEGKGAGRSPMSLFSFLRLTLPE